MKPTVSPSLLVLAAGMGSRFGGLKQIDPVGPNGEAILDYSVYDALRAGFGKVVFVIRRDIDAPFRATVGSRFDKRVRVEYVFQELEDLPAGFTVPAGRAKPWGTTQAILSAQGAIQEPFAVINADDFYGAEGYRLLAEHFQTGGLDYAMVGFQLRNTLSDHGTVARGVCRVNAEGFLDRVTELTRIERAGTGARDSSAPGEPMALTGDETVSMNMWGFLPTLFGQLRTAFKQFLERSGNALNSECYIPTTVGELIATRQARVKVLKTTDQWFGMTYREDRPEVMQQIRLLIEAGRYPEKLWP